MRLLQLFFQIQALPLVGISSSPTTIPYPHSPTVIITPITTKLFDYLTEHERITPNAKELMRIKANLQALYEAGPGAKM